MYNTILNIKNADAVTANLALLESYDQDFGLFNHDTDAGKTPFAVLRMHPAENPTAGSKTMLIIRELLACRVPELTNTPLMELLEYPRWILDEILEEARPAAKKEQHMMAELNNRIKK